jgi:hypothetical protein
MFILTYSKKYIYPPMAVKVIQSAAKPTDQKSVCCLEILPRVGLFIRSGKKRPSLTCSRGIRRSRTIFSQANGAFAPKSQLQ